MARCARRPGNGPRSPWLLAAAVLALRGVAAGAANGTAAGQGDCLNPMFAMYWAGKSDIRHLEATPVVQPRLNRCVAYRDAVACCPANFEQVLDTAFDRWTEHWRRKIAGIKKFRMQLAGIKLSDAYVSAVPDEQALLNKVLDTFPPIFNTYGDCFDTLLEYMAGVLCFSCDSHWRNRVVLANGNRTVAHIIVDDRDYDILWDECRPLADATSKIRARIADSRLAKLAASPLDDTAMFATKASVAEYAVSAGLLALRGPNENILKVQPQDNTGRRLAQPSPSGAAASAVAVESTSTPPPQPSSTAASAAAVEITTTPPPREGAGDPLRPVFDGRGSGFRCSVWPRRTSGPASGDTSGAAQRSMRGLATLIAALAGAMQLRRGA